MAVDRMRATICAAVIGVPAWFVSAASPAQENSVGTTIAWTCTQQYDNLFHARCVPSTTTPAHAMEPPLPDVDAPASDLRGHPVDARPVATRGRRTLLNYEFWLVPLYSVPTAPEPVRQLLHVVLCGKAPDCTVEYEYVRMEANLPARARDSFIR
jgi:hypothetical protein